jgi:GNAT superfamily N-acetyltransferase
MKIRPYTANDAHAVIKLWNESMTQDRINADKFYRMVVYDRNFDPEKLLIAEQEEPAGLRPIGFMYAVKRRYFDELYGLQEDQAWIAASGVEPSARRKGAAKTMLGAIEEKLKNEGAKKISLGPYPLNFFFPGVDKDNYSQAVEFFKANGYETSGESSSMHINLREYQTPAKYIERKKNLEEAGYCFKSFEPSDALSLFDFVREDFPWWLPDIRNSILAGRAEKTMILAREKATGITVGFVMRAMDGTPERFGPFGTKPTMQGNGLGAILFHEMMENLVREGLFYTYFLWTTGRNLDIYGTWGMTVYRTYEMMSKTF